MKVGTILLTLVAAIAVGASAALYIVYGREYGQRVTLSGQLDVAQQALQQAEQLAREYSQAKVKAERQLGDLRREVGELNEQMVEAERARERIAGQLLEKDETIERLESDLEVAQSDRVALEQEIQRLKAESTADAEPTSPVTTSSVNGDNAVNLTPVVVTQAPPPGAASARPAALEGEVMIINREFDFVIISIGRAGGAQVGQIYEVHRDGEPLGQLRVERIYDAFSAAAMLPDLAKQRIREHDSVRLL